MTPTWYDLLGVEPDASAETIRAAWKSGIADLDPGDRRFRSLNEAAEVLLDPERRAAYDASLEPEPEAEATPVSLDEDPDRDPDGTFDETFDEDFDAAETPPSRRRGTVPAWLLATLTALTLLMVVAAAYLASQPSDDAIADATSDAQSAAERGVVTILAYDYRTLDEDQKAAGELMTPDYKKDYDKLFEVIKENAEAVKPVVTVEVVASGIVRSGEDRVQVLVFVNRPTTNAKTPDPVVSRDQVVVTMEKSGDTWLVDNLDTNQLAN
jgi:Mce-associated membrane protein